MAEKENKKTTLKELGPSFPLGVEENGAYSKDFVIKRWTFKEEKQLGELNEDNKDTGMARFVPLVLSTMCTKFGPYDFEKMELNKKILSVSQMWAGDVFYAYCWLRYKSLGEDLGVSLSCPKCANDIDYVANVGTLEVSRGDTLDDFLWEYHLKEPFEIRGKIANGFVMQPLRWNSIETIMNDTTIGFGGVKSKVITDCIHSLIGENEQIALAEHEIEEMSKKDIEVITKKIESQRLGPDMSIEVKCKCRHSFVHQISWSYHDFFGSSSR